MLRPSQRSSLILSNVLAVLLLISLAVLCFLLPFVVESLCGTRDLIGDRSRMTQAERYVVLGLAYAMVAVAAVAILLLRKLLRVVSQGRVFSPSATGLLSTVSLCCFGEGVLFALTGIWFQLSFGVTLAVCFIGLCLRIVSNVIKEACRIKAENDLTI